MFAGPKIAIVRGVLGGAGLIMTLVVAGCAPSRADVLGTWRMDNRFGFELLKLGDNGLYEQEVRIRDERGVEHTAFRSGTWEYLTGRSTGILLRKCLSPLDIAGNVQPGFQSRDVNCYLAVDRKWPTSNLQLGSTEGETYERAR